MRRGVSTFRRIIAGLLVLVLLALPGPIMRHASAATHNQQVAAEHCASHAGSGTLADAVPVPAVPTSDSGQPDEPGADPTLPCCALAQCPAAAAVPPAASADVTKVHGATVQYAAPEQGQSGIKIRPALPPPRNGT